MGGGGGWTAVVVFVCPQKSLKTLFSFNPDPPNTHTPTHTPAKQNQSQINSPRQVGHRRLRRRRPPGVLGGRRPLRRHLPRPQRPRPPRARAVPPGAGRHQGQGVLAGQPHREAVRRLDRRVDPVVAGELPPDVDEPRGVRRARRKADPPEIAVKRKQMEGSGGAVFGGVGGMTHNVLTRAHV